MCAHASSKGERDGQRCELKHLFRGITAGSALPSATTMEAASPKASSLVPYLCALFADAGVAFSARMNSPTAGAASP